jgi:hypothetical protein
LSFKTSSFSIADGGGVAALRIPALRPDIPEERKYYPFSRSESQGGGPRRYGEAGESLEKKEENR